MRSALLTICGAAVLVLAACERPKSGSALASTPAPVRDAQVIGTIVATIDGREITWSAVRMQRDDGEAIASAHFYDDGSVSIRGEGGVEGTVVIAVEPPGEGAENGEHPVSVSHYPPNPDQPFWSSAGASGSATVTFDTLRTRGDRGRAEGRFEGRQCLIDAEGLADADQCRDITGTFATDLFNGD